MAARVKEAFPLEVGDLVRLFEDSEDATLSARKDAERDRDYVDNKQLSAAQRAVLKKRGQPDDIFNEIKRRVKFLTGLEKNQKVDPQALPNTPMHEDDAAGATMALRYAADAEDYDQKRSRIWSNLLVEGAGGISVRVEQDYRGELCVKLTRVAWDRMFWDPHSAEPDYSDAAYLGTVTWMDYEDALIDYPDKQDVLEATIASINPQDTYDDKPKFKVWADAKRKRIRVVKMWLKRGDQWFWAEFTRGGILKGGESPYVTDKGESDCELIFQSAYVDRDNNRYGDVRELIGPQNAINKGRQKALHLLNTSQVVMRDGAVQSVEVARREAARPDGVIVVQGNPNNALSHDFQFNTRSDLAAGHVQLMQQDLARFDLMGPNATMMGDSAGGGSSAASGKAIIASQQGGLTQLGDLLDNLRHLDRRVFRAIWYRIRQFWTGEKWVRITDDERNLKWVGINVDPGMLQQFQQTNPEQAAMIAGSVSNVAELDCDITIEDAPDTLTPQLEQFEALVALKQYDVNGELPFRALVAAAPNLRNKDRIFEEMDKAAETGQQQAQMRSQLEVQNAEAEIGLKQAQAAKAASDAQRPSPGPQMDHPAKVMADVEDKQAATTLKHTQAMKTALEAKLMPYQMAQRNQAAQESRAA